MISVLSQDYSNIEYIVIDGGSTDGTTDVIRKYGEQISVFVSEPDNGIYDAMNKGVRKASGDWVCFMNSSDCFASTDVISAVFRKDISSKVNVIYGNVMNDYGERIHIQKAYHLSVMKYRMPFCHQSVFARKEVLVSHPFNLHFKYSADYNQFYSIYFEMGEETFLYHPETIAICDATDCVSRKNMFPMWMEYMEIRSAHKDLRWYWDSFKNMLKVFRGYK